MSTITMTERLAKAREITEGMRKLNPDLMRKAENTVRRNMQSALEYTPHLFRPLNRRGQEDE